MKFLDRFRQKDASEKSNHLIVLVDYENAGIEAAPSIVDYDNLRSECLEIGTIDFSVVFAPEHKIFNGLSDYLYDRNYKVISCPSKSEKQKDRVDVIMTEVGKDFINLMPRLTHIVIVALDGDYLDLANHAKDYRKKIIAFSGENISSRLREVVDEVHPLPFKKAPLGKSPLKFSKKRTETDFKLNE